MTDTEALVFVVDDDASLRASLQDLLESVGLRVAACASAQDFLRHPPPEGPSCLVLDVRLPGLSGLELQQRLATGDLAMPIIFITGHGDIPMSVQAMKAGAVDFLPKPFRDQDLLDAIHQALARARHAHAQRAEMAALRHRFATLTLRIDQFEDRVTTLLTGVRHDLTLVSVRVDGVQQQVSLLIDRTGKVEAELLALNGRVDSLADATRQRFRSLN